MIQKMADTDRLCIHTITTKPLDFESACKAYARCGIKGITIWRDAIEHLSPGRVNEIVVENHLEVVSYCRGGFLASIDAGRRTEAVYTNIDMLKEAGEIRAPIMVMVCGADPSQSLASSDAQVKKGLEAILPLAEKMNVKLAIEPLHPMYSDDRSSVNTLRKANDLAEYFNSPFVGIALDVYHVWWDEALKEQIIRCGEMNKLYAFHICDWLTPTRDLLLDRGLMGEGCIPISEIRSWVEQAGFIGYNEVEIFSNRWWKTDQTQFLDKIVEAYMAHC